MGSSNEAAGSGAGATLALAGWAVNADLDGAGNRVRHEAVRTVLNWIACAVGGADNESVDAALAAMLPFSGPPVASVLGRTERANPLLAALVNGISSHVHDFDDTHIDTSIHPGGPVLAAILALAEHRPVSGRRLADALVVGVDVECRVGRCVYPSHYDAGWHITGTAGIIGAAAACARLLGLDQRRAAWALGSAATQAGGFREVFGSMGKCLHVGRAAQGGLGAALLAASGFNSSEQALEGRRGFARVFASAQDFDALTADLGLRFEIESNSYKPFPCGLVVHPAIDACLQLRAEHGFAADEIESVRLGVHPLVPDLCGKREPRDELEGKFSIYHAAAVALARGRAGMAEFSDQGVTDPAVIAVRERVSAEVRPGVDRTQVEVGIDLRGGRRIQRRLDEVVGSVQRPLSDEAMADKVHDLCDARLGEPRVDRLIDECRRLYRLDDAATLCRGAVPA